MLLLVGDLKTGLSVHGGGGYSRCAVLRRVVANGKRNATHTSTQILFLSYVEDCR